MKKATIIAVAAFIGLSFSSCKKDWTCTCSAPGIDEEVFEIKDKKKGDAKDACDAAGLIYTFAGGSCSLD
jgi:hypothetical protein